MSDKTEAIKLHEKANSRAVRAAAKAVVELFALADRERGGLFAVKWAARLVVRAFLFQWHARFDHIDNVDASQQVTQCRSLRQRLLALRQQLEESWGPLVRFRDVATDPGAPASREGEDLERRSLRDVVAANLSTVRR